MNDLRKRRWLLPTLVVGCTAAATSFALAGDCIQAGDGCGDDDNGINAGCNDDGDPSYDELGELTSDATISYCGTVGTFNEGGNRDLDWARYSLAQPGTVTLSVTHNAPDLVVFMSNGTDCDALDLPVATETGDSPVEFTAVLPAGEHLIIFTVAFPDEGNGSECGTIDFEATLSVESGEFASCGDPKAGECTEPNGTPGCSDFECCESVCALNPLCCELSWDEICVELGVKACGFFIYECVAPNQDNDCVADASEVFAGDSIPYNTAGANTDGPPQPECQSANGDEQVWSDLWYFILADIDGELTASNCFDADFDSKIAIYNLGTALPSEIDPQFLPDFFVACNEDCADDPFFASEQTVIVEAGSIYLIRLGGFEQQTGTGNLNITLSEIEPPPPPQTCDAGGNTELTQSNEAVADDGQVACAGGGITTENEFARSFDLSQGATAGQEYVLNCVDFGFSNTGSLLVGSIDVYVDPDGGAPVGPELELLASDAVSLDGDGFVGNLIAAFDEPVFCPVDSTIVVVINIPPSTDGFAVCGGNAAGETEPTYLRSGSCGIVDFTTYADIGFPDANWAVTLIGDVGGGGCPECPDFTEDGMVDGADLGILLAAWGTDTECVDINEDGNVDGADLGLLLGAWGPCLP